MLQSWEEHEPSHERILRHLADQQELNRQYLEDAARRDRQRSIAIWFLVLVALASAFAIGWYLATLIKLGR